MKFIYSATLALRYWCQGKVTDGIRVTSDWPRQSKLFDIVLLTHKKRPTCFPCTLSWMDGHLPKGNIEESTSKRILGTLLEQMLK